MVSPQNADLELTSYTPSLSDVEPLRDNPIGPPTTNNDGFSLPPTDGGKDAWLFLFACFMLEAMIWGS